jgi:hypothetical protein
MLSLLNSGGNHNCLIIALQPICGRDVDKVFFGVGCFFIVLVSFNLFRYS